MSNLPPPPSRPIYAAQTYRRFQTVEHYFKPAVLSHPCVVEIDWRLKSSNFATQRNQLQSSLSALRRNPHWARPWCDWDITKLTIVLEKLVVRYDPERSQYILLGDAFHMANEYAFRTVSSSFPRRETLYSDSAIATQQEVTLPSRHEEITFGSMRPLMLDSSMNPNDFCQCIAAYAFLSKFKIGNLPPIKVPKPAASINMLKEVELGKLQCLEYQDYFLIS